MQAQLRRRAGVVEAVHVELAAVCEVGCVPARILTDAARLAVAGQRNRVNVSLHRTVERTCHEQPVPGLVDVQQRRARACAVDDVPVAGRQLSQQLTVIVVQVQVGMAAALGAPDELGPRLEEAQRIVKIDPGVAGLGQQDPGFAAPCVNLQ